MLAAGTMRLHLKRTFSRYVIRLSLLTSANFNIHDVIHLYDVIFGMN